MAWDFSTDPEFQKKLDWAYQFVREEVEDLDLRYPEMHYTPTSGELKAVTDPLKQKVRDTACGPPTSAPSSAATGYGQVSLALLNEILGRTEWGPTIFGDAGPRHRQRRDPRPLRHRCSRRHGSSSPSSTARSSRATR